ncbi:class I SAM-dependent methyltransferase [Streptomyces spiralis]
MAGNAAQATVWNGDEGRFWVRELDRLEAMHRRFRPHLLDAARIAEDARVLDIGCGAGATTCAAARRAAHGEVLGLDLSGPLLDEARRLAGAQDLPHVRFEQADVQTWPFPQGAFDVALSQFGVMFFDDPETAFGNLARALRPDGRLAFLCWRPITENEWFRLSFDVVAKLAPVPAAGGPQAPGPFSLADPDRIRTLLEGTGFTAVTVRPVTEPMRVGDDVEDVVGCLLDSPGLRSALAAADAQGPGTAAALEAARKTAECHLGPGGVTSDGAAWLVTADRAMW